MKNDPPVNDLSNIGANRYPHIKITNETFPRALATRLIEDDGDEYFGAFLPKTAARILIDFLNRIFRLRSCDIEIDGSFPVPCTQYFRRRCVAPCVASTCSRKEYLQIVDLARFFLANDRESLVQSISAIVDQYSKRDDFESAARYRDMMVAIDRFWNEPRWNVWLDDAVDTIAAEETSEGTTLYLVTHRGRKVLGRKVLVAHRNSFPTPESAIRYLVENFYLFHLPREIRMSHGLLDRRELETQLSARFGSQAKLTVSDPKRKGKNALRGLDLSHAEHLLDQAKPVANAERISSDLSSIFNISAPVGRVEAFDVAHISGTVFVAASAVWINGQFDASLYRFHFSSAKSEVQSLADTVMFRLVDPHQELPHLIVIDGGTSQLNAVLKKINEGQAVKVPIIAAVKPRGKHSSIAAFLTEDGRAIPFDVDSPAHAMLQLLRDEAHDLANRVHRDYREMLPFFEARGFDRPLVVPLRFHAENGGAEDLMPIGTR